MNEIATTYLVGWLLLPALVMWPFPILVIEIWRALGLPESLHPFAVGFSILWMVVVVWRLADWDEKRKRPIG